LFDDAGGGATEEDGATAIDIASSVPPAVAAVVRDALALASVPSTETSSAFVLVSRPSAKR
jgi:acyl transferase domain-containing protein